MTTTGVYGEVIPTSLSENTELTHVTFGVSASPFAAKMALRENAIDYTSEFPLAVEAVFNSFYVHDDSDSEEEVITLQRQLHIC